jgi:hypothetical protein
MDQNFTQGDNPTPAQPAANKGPDRTLRNGPDKLQAAYVNLNADLTADLFKQASSSAGIVRSGIYAYTSVVNN